MQRQEQWPVQRQEKWPEAGPAKMLKLSVPRAGLAQKPILAGNFARPPPATLPRTGHWPARRGAGQQHVQMSDLSAAEAPHGAPPGRGRRARGAWPRAGPGSPRGGARPRLGISRTPPGIARRLPTR